jgi:predicted ATP-grasp superfamily ATP-dependent carboligase
MRTSRILSIVGASTRAAAFSALRAGFSPRCADLFADRDLVKCTNVTRLSGRSYPDGFLDFLKNGPTAPWIYTGGLENHAALIERMASVRELWGNGRSAVTAARSVWHVRSLFESAGIPFPRVHSLEEPLFARARWLLKSPFSTGGSGVSWWTGGSARCAPGCYLQEYIEGDPCAAVFIGDGKQTGFVGLTRQLVGEGWLHAKPFHYCGSIGPLQTDPELRHACEALGSAVANGCGLRGVFGVDCVLRDGVLWPIEINPRYPASAEILESAFGESILAAHCRAFDREIAAAPRGVPAPSPRIIGKAILFAKETITFPEDSPWLDDIAIDFPPLAPPGRGDGGEGLSAFAVPRFADIPSPGEQIPPGRPIFTIFAEGVSLEDCTSSLRRRVAEVESLLYDPDSRVGVPASAGPSA